MKYKKQFLHILVSDNVQRNVGNIKLDSFLPLDLSSYNLVNDNSKSRK